MSAERRQRLAEARLYLVVTPALCRAGLVPAVRGAIDGGAAIVQLRDKESDDAAFVAAARRIAPLCAASGVLFLINDRAHLIRDCDADGVHVGDEDMPPEEVREREGAEVIVGLSTHDRAEVQAAAGRGADYVGLGPMFATETKSLTRAPRGPDLVRECAGATSLPLFPIGGITATNLPSLLTAGARRAAVSSAICAAADPRAAASALARLLLSLP